ncbi:MAG TPA: NAD(P)-dependent oxidoreductase [Candidatus Dormibacteraeota bacterium]|nr:NAD(P)-dependent oxidoreductase [Candidatus Dormibacteraeota bacterium]
MITGMRVLVTGASGKVALPIARALAAAGNEVYGLARFAEGGGTSTPGAQAALAAVGITPIAGDVGRIDMATLPDVDYVFHAGAALSTAFEVDPRWSFEVNAQATGRMMARYRDIAGFVYCSSGSVYRYQGQRPLREDDPPGEHLGIYSWSKVAGENVVTFASRQWGIPATIIRIFSTYGPLGGAPAGRLALILAGKAVPLHPQAPNNYNPIYEDDYVALGIRALEVAGTPPITVNWAGSETVSAEDYCAYLAELAGRELRIDYTADAYYALWPDVSYMHEVLGRTQVHWRDGMRRMVEALHPELRAGASNSVGGSTVEG